MSYHLPNREIDGPGRLLPTLARALCAWLVAGWTAAAWGGGGPENVLLVVNPQSSGSLTIGNHYVRLRQIPAANVLYLPWNPSVGITDVDTFRREILGPVIKAVQSRSPVCQIDYVVYSSDFPWEIKLEADVEKFLARQGAEGFKAAPGQAAPGKAIGQDDSVPAPSPQPQPGQPGLTEWPYFLTKSGSINGLTYLWQPVLEGNAAYMGLDTNWYLRRPTPQQQEVSSLAFSSSYHFGSQGELVPAGGRVFLLSMMLGVTAGRGNTLAEVLAYLERSAAADGTHPPGTIYFVKNGGVRSQTRDWAYAEARRQLESLGVAAEILEGIAPNGKSDVQGVMLGTAGFDWKASGSVILPGAICDHFTSFGGAMTSETDQTPLSEFLRDGAAAACGTVVEPYSLQPKFPLASIHVHYARGCSLAEAFYQSVFGPYQLLIVGDPLCRPWANIPEVRVSWESGPAPGDTVPGDTVPGDVVKGVLTLLPSATLTGKGDAAVERFELFVDGVRRARSAPGEPLKLNTAVLPDGYHELRVVAFTAGPIRTQGRWIAPITTANHGRSIEVSVTPRERVAAGEPLVVDVKAPGSIGVALMQNSRLLGRINGPEGRLEIDSGSLGQGPVRLSAVGLAGGGSSSDVVAAPIELIVEPNKS